MDMTVSYSFNSSKEAAAADGYPSLRYFSVISNYSTTPLREFLAVSPWTVASHETAPNFSGVCWFSARDIHDGLRAAGQGDVPMGMLHSALGGTALQEWMSPAAASVCPPATTGPNYAYTHLFNAMISPLLVSPSLPLSLSLVVFYQGEANVLQSAWYACGLAAHTRDWLAAFHLRRPGSFHVVQLAAWNASTDPSNVYYMGGVADLRNSQALAVAATPGAELATAIDGGDPSAPATSIHPRNKQLVGQRVAAAALARHFAVQGVAYAAPRYASATATASGTALSVAVALAGAPGAPPPRLVWVPPTPASNSNRCPTDRTIPPSMCAGLEVQLSSGAWVPAVASIDAAGTGLLLTATAPQAGVTAVATRNGHAAWPVVNVYTVDGSLPLLPWVAQAVGQ